MKGRATTQKQKEEILNRLKKLWLGSPQLRLGQLIGNVFDEHYYIEDFPFVEALEKVYKKN